MSAVRRLAARPSSAASHASEQYFGPGLSIQEQTNKPSPAPASALEEENAALREQVQHLQHLLTLVSPSDSDSGPSTSNSNSNNSNSNSKLPKPLQPLQRHKAQIAQLQRQVNTLQAELLAQRSMCLEADAIIHEASRHLDPLLAAIHSSNSRGVAAPGAATAGGASATRSASAYGGSGAFGRSSSAVGAAAGGAKASGAPGLSQQVLQECGDLAAWCRQMQHRLARARAQASVAFRKLTSEDSSNWSGSKGPQHAAGGMHTSLPYIPAGGNRFLRHSSDAPPLTIPALCAGHGILLSDVSQTHALEMQLGALAPNLASLAVALRSVLLPAMPWLSQGAGPQLLGDVAETAEAAAAAAAGLAELACLLPATCSLAGAGVRVAANGAAARAAARQQADAWGSEGVQWDGSFGVVGSQSHGSEGESSHGDDVAHGPGSAGLTVEELQLFEHVQAALAAQAGSQAAGADARGNPQRLSTGGSSFNSSRGQELFGIGGTTSSPSRAPSRATGPATAPARSAVTAAAKRGLEALQQLRLRFMVQAWQRRVLEVQLGFVAEASSAQARLVSQLVVEVVDAVKASTATPAAEAAASQHRQLLVAVQSLIKATRLLEQRPGEAASRGALECLMRHANVLDVLPEVLESSSAPNIQAAAVAAAQNAYADYSRRLHASQAHCSAAAKHAKQQAARLHKQYDVAEG